MSIFITCCFFHLANPEGNNIIHAGKNKFRSDDTAGIELEAISKKYNLEAPREVRGYEQESDFKENHFFESSPPK